LGEDQINDQNRIQLIIMIKQGLNIFRLVFILFNACYFLGIFWFIILELYGDAYLDKVYSTSEWGEYVEFCELPDGVDHINNLKAISFLYQNRMVC